VFIVVIIQEIYNVAKDVYENMYFSDIKMCKLCLFSFVTVYVYFSKVCLPVPSAVGELMHIQKPLVSCR